MVSDDSKLIVQLWVYQVGDSIVVADQRGWVDGEYGTVHTAIHAALVANGL